jgi:spore maturation protein CgeB
VSPVNILVAGSGQGVVEHLRRLNPQRAAAIGEAARRRVLDEHTYDHRGGQVVETFDELLRSARR